jgi:hypothetical protein
MTEIIPGTLESLGAAHANLKHVTEEDSSNVQMVGPWPLKRGSSSETIVATREGFECGFQGASTDGPSQGKPEFSALMDAVDKQCEQIKVECDQIKPESEEAKLTFDENAEILEGTRAQLTRLGAGDIRIVDAARGRNMEGEALPEGSATTGRDTEQQAGERAHALGSCCRQCNKILQRKESSARAGAWVVDVCGVVILFSPGLFAQGFSKDGKAAIFDVQGDSEKTLYLFFGLLVIPAAAVGIVVAIAQWSLLRHNRLSGMSKSAKAHNRSRIMGVSILICWMFLLVMGSFGPLSTYLTPMK